MENVIGILEINMNHSAIIVGFLRWLTAHPEIKDWKEGLKYYLEYNRLDYSERDWKQLTKIVKSALRRLEEN